MHGGSVNSPANRFATHGCNPDLHVGNIAFEISDLDSKSEEGVIVTLGPQECVPVITKDHLRQTDSLPKYLIVPGKLGDRVERGNLRVKIIDLGEGSLRWPQSFHRALRSRSLLEN